MLSEEGRQAVSEAQKRRWKAYREAKTNGNGEIHIDKNVPLVAHGNTKYPFTAMKVGDSFFTTQRQVRNSSFRTAAQRGWKFTVRKVEGGFRCWRIK